jgi:phosphohistidine phosphatase
LHQAFLEPNPVQLFLMRHSIAEAQASTDFDRRLTPEGVKKVDALVAFLLQEGFSPGAIVHSPLIRSQQTAQAFSKHLPNTPVLELSEVVSARMSLLQVLGGANLENPLIIGHNPGISILASALGDEALRFKTCSFASFEVDTLPPRESRLARWLPTLPKPS